MFVSVIARRLRPGKTCEDFLAAWYPDRGFGVPVTGPYLTVNVADEREILAVAVVDIPDRAGLEAAAERIAAQEAARHDRIAEVVEATTVKGIYEVRDTFDFSTDATVAAGRR